MTTVSVNLRDVRQATKNIQGLGWKTRKIQGEAIMVAGKVLKKAVVDHMSSTAYSLQDLENMDHPYARRHGSIRVHPKRPFIVHRQSGRMRESVTLEEINEIDGGMVSTRARVGLDYGRQRYFKYVIQGTKVMLPRDTLYQVSQLRNVRKGMMKAVVNVIGRELRTQATVRFG